MYCPECRFECGDGSTECPACHVLLPAGTDVPARADHFDSDRDLVVVFEANDRIQLAMAVGLLEDAGIPYFVLGQIATLVQDVDGFLHKWTRVQVSRDRESEAKELLEQLLAPTSRGAGEHDV